MQEPFKSVPLIWTIHERALAIRSRQYTSSWQIELLNDWRKAFNRATVVVFPNHVLPVIDCDKSSTLWTLSENSMGLIWTCRYNATPQ
jgi:hypothetical protein